MFRGLFIWSERMDYLEKLKDPRWQQVRLKIFERDGWKCQYCGDDKATLVVHHLRYEKNKEPWEGYEANLITLCQNCHKKDHLYRKISEQILLGNLKNLKYNFRSILSLTQLIGFLWSDDMETFHSALVYYLGSDENIKHIYENFLIKQNEVK
jgi:hypothetical protein